MAAVLTAAYVLLQMSPGLSTRFAPDDMQNIYTYWNPGPWHWIRPILQVATAEYRPLGAVFYLPLFHWFGFNPQPFRIVIFVLLVVNAGLLYLIARRVTGSREAAAIAVLAGGYHASATGTYLSTSTIYEVLCFLFMVSAFLVYLRRGPLMLFVVLYAAALESKEMAVVLPAILLVYELLIEKSLSFLRRPSFLVSIVLAAAVLAAKVLTPNTFTAFEAYRPVLSWTRYLETSRAYVAELLLFRPPASAALTIGFWIGVFALAAALRNRKMLFGAGFAWIALLPVNFVTAREGFVLYIPLLGFGIYLGALFVDVLDRFRWPYEVRAQAGALVFVSLLVALPLLHRHRAAELEGALHGAQEVTWRVLSEFKRLNPQLARGGKVLYDNTPFSDSDVYFIAKLYARDRTLQVCIGGQWGPAKRGDRYDDFDQQYRFDGTTLIRSR